MFPLGVDIGGTTVAAAVWRRGRAEQALLAARRPGRDTVLPLLGTAAPVLVRGVPRAPVELAADLLREVLDAVPASGRVALTYPDGWAGHRRAALLDAARRAGITVTEPLLLSTAAAAALHLAGPLPAGELVTVCHLGGTSCTVTPLRGTGAVPEPAGPPRRIPAGGEDIDQLLFSYVVSAGRADELSARSERRELRSAMAAAREGLTGEEAVTVRLPGAHRDVEVTRAVLDDLVRTLLAPVSDALSAVATPVLLTGGLARMPAVAAVLSAGLGRPVTPASAEHAQAAALGAARAAAGLDPPGWAPFVPAEPVPAPPPAPAPVPAPAVVAPVRAVVAPDDVVTVHTGATTTGVRGRVTAVLVIAGVLLVLALAVAFGR
ncbi:heat shock protein 70 [Actinoplanes sp. SE50]|uniref:Hsp70 family protein n=1 Tax=unclassified Actinoplanes TaxID=2626549 RepID=UPI00023EC912|nr:MULTISPECIES: Hsp70 family protein [unclassified Actinoplanes]AEV83124.1 heat shock protein 70 [Actinoplanes sp. SE50/110]ATO81519.1 heat shock protein 70 [Actinoplanes sp. SE50]SLL98926.1 hypothetical protein ACSP50_2153 [Actinoplanes sp. SE50/110]